jgi:DEAD/DEAH box helicase domain-containing protein
MSASAFVEYIKAAAGYQGQIVHIEHLPSQTPSYQEPANPLHSRLESALRASDLYPLYTHQANAIDLVRSGKNVVVVTGAASGKTLCYNVPVLQSILTDKASRALYLFPTKALAQDQLRSLTDLISLLPSPVKVATFDGDTPREERSYAKRSAQIVLTNPDMLHLGILPNHQSWSRFLRRLNYVVIDEVHTYRGIFGSHVGNVMRRLRRLLDSYGARPQFICCSATIANPREHVERLVGLPFQVVDTDAAPHGRKDFILWNPPLVEKAKASRISANSEAAFLLSELVQRQVRTITFARTRKLTELIYIYARQRLGDSSLAQRIKPYRGGYLPEDRRRIEQELFHGELLGVVATTALEMGIDIGDLDAAVLTGYPGSIASTWQQAGRSGRRTGTSLAFLIGLDNPLDQYFMRHPEALFGKRCENALIDPANQYVMKSHLVCAAWESPLTGKDSNYWGDSMDNALSALEEDRLLRERGGRWYPMPSIAYPAEGVNIRSASSLNYTILDASQGNRQIETIDASVALSQVHPGAIYLHYGEPYIVTQLDLTARCAYVVPADVPYYTQAKELTEIRVVKTLRERDTPKAKCYVGEVEVTTTVIGFRRKMQFTEAVIGEEFLDLPPNHFNTVGVWFDLPEEAIDRIAETQLDFAGGLHAAEHACIALLPLFALCDRNDLGGVSTPFHPDTRKPQIFIYDAHPGGTGIAEKGFELIQDLWRETLRLINECPCDDGCPSCVQSPKCGNNNQPLDKKAAQAILQVLTQQAGEPMQSASGGGGSETAGRPI